MKMAAKLSAVPSVYPTFSHRSASPLGIDGNEENYSRSGRPIRVVNDGSVVEELFKAL